MATGCGQHGIMKAKTVPSWRPTGLLLATILQHRMLTHASNQCMVTQGQDDLAACADSWQQGQASKFRAPCNTRLGCYKQGRPCTLDQTPMEPCKTLQKPS